MRIIRVVSFFLGVLSCGQALAQTTSPLVQIQIIPVPTWTNTGATQANLDIFGFNPRTRMLYIADRTNHAVTAVDTVVNAVVGVLPIPGGGNTNGAMVASDVQKLVVTDGKANVFVYDLRVPSVAPVAYALPGVTGGTDALDYDPLNHTVYVINGTAPYFITGIDLVNNVISSQLALPGSPELMRFNPNDGLIYQAITDGDNKGKNQGLYVYDPIANVIKTQYLTPNCTPHGVEIDPVTNVALLGCSPGGQTMLDLSRNGAVIKTFPNISGTDLTAFNPNTRNFYTGSGGNNAASNGCPTDSSKNFPLIGVFNSTGPGLASLVGVQCTGRSAKGPGVNPIDNFIYVGTRQYPVDPADATTGQNGLIVYWDSSPRGDANPGSSVTLTSLGTSQVYGSLQFTTAQHRGLRAYAALKGVAQGAAMVNVPTSVGNETVPCSVAQDGSAVCDGSLFGAPMLGAPALLAVGGAPVGKGTIQ